MSRRQRLGLAMKAEVHCASEIHHPSGPKAAQLRQLLRVNLLQVRPPIDSRFFHMLMLPIIKDIVILKIGDFQIGKPKVAGTSQESASLTIMPNGLARIFTCFRSHPITLQTFCIKRPVTPSRTTGPGVPTSSICNHILTTTGKLCYERLSIS